MFETELTTETARQVGSRSVVYSLLSRGFAFPNVELYEEVRTGRFLSQTVEAANGLPYPLEVTGQLGNGMDSPYEDFESLYLSLFEVGGPLGSPAPLYEGHYGGGLLRDMEEVLRLYHHFGLKYTGGFRPDHLQTELEFMHVLTLQEAAGSESREAQNLYARAERDFLQYHLQGLALCVGDGLSGRSAPFYPELARVLVAFVESDLRALTHSGL